MELVIVDTAQIQPYIFGSSRLRENIGASYLVRQTTEIWPLEVTNVVAPKNNIKHVGTGELDDQTIEGHNLDAEVLYTGGGNAVILLRSTAQAFMHELTRLALRRAPGLQLVVARRPFDWEQEPLSAALESLFLELSAEKARRPRSAPLLGLGVTVMCQSTGLPALGWSPDIEGAPDAPRYPVSAEIMAKLKAVDEANRRLDHDLKLPGLYQYPYDLDNLGRSRGEFSYLAVAHADGDALGDRMQGLGAAFRRAGPETMRAHITALRAFSNALRQAGLQALTDTLAALMARTKNARVEHDNAFGQLLSSVAFQPVRDSQEKPRGDYYLPFRPLVFGGDDVTFVADGRLGLSLALTYMARFEELTKALPDNKGSATASAGVAIVKSHYPFARAYELAVALTGEAKSYRRELIAAGATATGGCLDWHFAQSGLLGSVETIRANEYQVAAGHLTLRPVTRDANSRHEYRAWLQVATGLAAFQDVAVVGDQPRWSGRRNKVKALRDALREGPAETREFLELRGLADQLPPIAGSPTFAREGWHNRYCGYFDALELADWLIPL